MGSFFYSRTEKVMDIIVIAIIIVILFSLGSALVGMIIIASKQKQIVLTILRQQSANTKQRPRRQSGFQN